MNFINLLKIIQFGVLQLRLLIYHLIIKETKNVLIINVLISVLIILVHLYGW